MSRDIYNVVKNNHVYLIYTDDGVGGCVHLGTVHKKFRLYKKMGCNSRCSYVNI